MLQPLRFIINSVEFYPESYSTRESVFEYSFVLTFESGYTLTPVPFTVTNGEVSFDFRIVGIEIIGHGRFRYTCYPEAYVELLNTVFPALGDTQTLEVIMASLGLDVSVYQPTQPVYWSIVASKGRYLLDTLIGGALVKDGGCPTLFCSMSGKFIFSDILAEVYSEVSSVFMGSLENSPADYQFISKVPGVVDFYFYNEADEIVEVRETFLEGFGLGSVRQLVTNALTQDLVIRKARNRFWRNYINGSKLVYSDCMGSGIFPGRKVLCSNSEQEMVVLTCTTSFTDMVPSSELEVIPLIKPE